MSKTLWTYSGWHANLSMFAPVSNANKDQVCTIPRWEAMQPWRTRPALPLDTEASAALRIFSALATTS
jgi:hypothetical protein